MKNLLFCLLLTLLFAGCSDPVPQRIDPVEGEMFGQLPSDRDCAGEKVLISRRMLSEADTVELFVTPISKQVWRIDLIFAQVPGGDGDDPVNAVKKWLEPRYGIKFNSAGSVELAETIIRLHRAFERGPRGVSCSFIDRKLQDVFSAESKSPESAENRQNSVARGDILFLENALHEYNLDTDTYPVSLEGLLKNDGTAKWNGPYLRDIPLDPWKKPYVYRRRDTGFELYSAGADGKSRLH